MAENRSTFEFKQFSLDHGNPGLKISTEACLFGAWASLHAGGLCLDIGTGCGLLASMMAQANTECSVKALEIHPEVAILASENFEQNPFKDRLQVIQSDISAYHSEVKFDFICSNPPFFTNHLPATDPARHMAIHADHLSPADLANSIDRLLAAEGEFAVLYPADVLALFEQSLENLGLYINEKVNVLSKPDSPVLRVMARGSRKEELNEEHSLPIKTEQGDYSTEFIELLRPYYIIFPS
ncbi:methyltransferase [Aquirufa sp. 2-AUSEE-184A6]|uniref:Methyltransferase n=1 Tax=Aquirufa novilacunae TaxID=3139305 RepID=A0ABW8SWD7_9BACT